MTEVTRILNALADGDPLATERLFPLVYDELRRLAGSKMRSENPGQTLDGTALVHEAYLRLVGSNEQKAWDNRRHFFAAAAEAMRRILVESARRKSRLKHGGDRQRLELVDQHAALVRDAGQVLAVNDALEQLAAEDETAAQVAKLRYFTGFSIEEAGDVLAVSRATAYRHWQFAKAWLQCELKDWETGTKSDEA